VGGAAELLDPCRALWTRALSVSPHALRETLLGELAAYYGLDRSEVLRRCRTASAHIAAAWRDAAPRSAAHVEAFYRQPLDYAFDLLWWHSLAQGDRGLLCPLPGMRAAYRLGARRALDFGGGGGSHALTLAACGFDVTLADVSADLLAFAAWRARLRDRALRMLLLPRDPLGGPYDLMLAVDVFEHLPAPADTLAILAGHLREGGFIFINMAAGPSAEAPQHIGFWGEQLVIEGGFREVLGFGPGSVLLQRTGPPRLRGAPPRYEQAPPRSRPGLPVISPALWWQQTAAWRAAGRLPRSPAPLTAP